MVELQLTFRYLWLWLSVLVGLDFGKGRIAIQEVENDEVFSSVSLSFTHTLAPTATHAYALEYLPRYHNTEPHSSR